MKKRVQFSRRQLITSLLAAAALALSGCSSLPFSNGLNFNIGGNTKSKPSLRVVFDRNCPIADGDVEGLGASLLPALLPMLINQGVKYLSKGVVALAEAQKTKATARKNGHFLRGYSTDGLFHAHEDMGCVVIAYGEFGAKTVPTDKIDGEFGEYWPAYAEDWHASGLTLSKPPRFYFEGRPTYSSDGTKFALESAFIYYDGPLRKANGKGARDVGLTFTFNQREGESFAIGTLLLPNLEAGKVVNSLEGEIGLTTGWLQVPAPSEADQLQLANYCEGAPNRCTPLDRSGNTVANNLTGDCVENGRSLAEAAPSRSGAICSAPFTLQVELIEDSKVADFLTQLAQDIEYAGTYLAPTLEANLAREFLGPDAYDPRDPETRKVRKEAREACQALAAARQTYLTAPPDQVAGAQSKLITKTDEAKAAYEKAGLHWWRVVSDSVVGCRFI